MPLPIAGNMEEGKEEKLLILEQTKSVDLSGRLNGELQQLKVRGSGAAGAGPWTAHTYTHTHTKYAHTIHTYTHTYTPYFRAPEFHSTQAASFCSSPCV